MNSDEQFFYDNAGYSHAVDESPEAGNLRCAQKLAAAEKRLKAGPYVIEVIPDYLPWDGDFPYDGPLWIVQLLKVPDDDQKSVLVGSLHGVACETDASPYIRVVSAELALEHIPE